MLGNYDDATKAIYRRRKTRWVVDIKKPRLLFPREGANYWRRPTFAQPIEALSSGLQRFTSVFGMGPGGTTALESPEVYRNLKLSTKLVKFNQKAKEALNSPDF